MTKFQLNRRRFLTAASLGLSGAALSGCDAFDFLVDRDNKVRNFLGGANDLTYHAQRLVAGRNSMAQEYREADIRQPQRPNGVTSPDDATYKALLANDFADWRLEVTGLVEKPMSLSRQQLMNMPARTQITRHDCVEGWSCIAKWSGTRLGPLLDQAGVKPAARFCVYHCYDVMGGGLAGTEPYYESSDLIDAYHPQTILAYGLNNEVLPVSNGAPVRLRIERALGYKQPKYLHTVELVDSFAGFGQGQGGYWPDHGYDWYGGI